jgi:hypothetical protein
VQFFYKNSTNLGAVDWGMVAAPAAPAVRAVAALEGSDSAPQPSPQKRGQTIRARPLTFSSLGLLCSLV